MAPWVAPTQRVPSGDTDAETNLGSTASFAGSRVRPFQ
jgi:hypothetical protein